jgi:hypothetical protein
VISPDRGDAAIIAHDRLHGAPRPKKGVDYPKGRRIVRYRISQGCEGLVRARPNWRTRRGGSETRTALADIAANIVFRLAGSLVLGLVGFALALPSIAQASPKPDPTPQAAPSTGSGPSPDPAPQAHSSSSSGSSVSAPSTSYSSIGNSSSSSGKGSSSVTPPVVIQPSISGAAVAEPSIPTHASTTSTSSAANQGALRTVPLRHQARTRAHLTRHHSTQPGVRIQPSLFRRFFALPALSLLKAGIRLPSAPGNGLLFLLGAGAFFVLAAASGSLLRMLRRMPVERQGR